MEAAPRRAGLSVIMPARSAPAHSPEPEPQSPPSSAWSAGLRGRDRSRVGLTGTLRTIRVEAHPLVIGHRGSTAAGCRENSVDAVLTAMALGADGVEVDVRLSSDGVLMCSHDAVVTTSLGRELTVSETSAAELIARAARDADGHLATLPEVLAVLAAQGTSHVVVEAKPVADQIGAFRTARALANLLVPLSNSMVITVSSFDPILLGAVRRMVFGTRVRTAVLGPATESAVAVLRRADEAGDHEVHLSLKALRESPHAVRMAHQRGIAVTAWTVNGADLAEVAALGVDAVITDHIAAARAAACLGASPLPVALAGVTAC